jgi:DDE superfamily endonuclease
MLLAPMPWAGRIWALPLMTVLCPAERFYEQQGRRHQTLVERAWHIIHVVVRWLPRRAWVFVADSSYAVLELLHQVSEWPRASLITRLRLDAALYDPPPTREPGQLGRPRLKGDRRPTLEAVLADEETPWRQLTIERWYGDAPREVEVATESAVC